jgi:hypothetical protein
MSWNIQKPGDYINGPLTVVGAAQFNSNVGVGVAPSAWNSNYNAIDIGANGSVSGRLGASNTVDITSNAFRNSAGDWVYKIATSSPAARYQVDGSSGSHIWYSGAAGTVGNIIAGFSTALMTLNSSGNLGLGASPLARLHSSNGQTVDSGLFNGLVIGGTGSSSARTASFIKNTSSPYDLIIRTQDFSGTTTGSLIVQNGSTEVGRINANGVYVLPGGAVGANGVGIAFPAAQSASTDANTLDDYEEGTFTPVVRGSSVAGSGTYANQVGFYTKVGRLVTVNVWLNWSAHSGTGFIQFGGLPFLSANTAGNYGGISIGYQSGITSAANTVLYGLTEFGTNIVTVAATPTGGGGYGLVSMDAAGEIAFTATYWV